MKNDFLVYNNFRKLAVRKDLSRHEKIGGSDYVREGYSEAIIADIVNKLPTLLV